MERNTRRLSTFFADNWAFVFMFLLFSFINLSIPIINDGWGNHSVYDQLGGFLPLLRYMSSWYQWMNGRIVATVLCGFLERNKVLLDLVNAATMAGISFCVCRLFDCTRQKIFVVLLSVTTFLLVPDSVRVEVYFYATTIYVFPILLILLFGLSLKKYLSSPSEFQRRDFIVMCVEAFACAAWIENISFGFTAAVWLIVLYRCLKNKKADASLLWVAVLSTVALLTLVLSPGIRLHRQVTSQNTSFFTTLFNNLADMIQVIILSNLPLMILFIAALLFYISFNKKIFGSKMARTIYTFYLVFLLLLLAYQYLTPKYGFPPVFAFLFPVSGRDVFGIVVWILIILSFYIPLFLSEDRVLFSLLYFIALFSLLPMCVVDSTNQGARIDSISIFMVCCLIVGLFARTEISRNEIKKALVVACSCLLFLSADKYVLLCNQISDIQTERETLIGDAVLLQREGKWDFNRVLTLPRFSRQELPYGASPDEGTDEAIFHFPLLLSYYHLDSETKVAFNDIPNVLRVESRAGEITMTNEPVHPEDIVSYHYLVAEGGQAVVSTQSNSPSFKFKDTLGARACYYTFQCILTDRAGNTTTVNSYKTVEKK